jgi:Na+/melibiose symporter-like transporter
MTGACWFNYLLYFLVNVSDFSPTNAGFIMLSGQISDAIFNPLVGYLSDKTKSKYGRRKTWLAAGATLVSFSFYFVFSGCHPCHQYFRNMGVLADVLYCSALTAIFNVGWAAVQVAHMSMAPEITDSEHERVRLYSARSASGIVASFLVLALAAVAFKIYGVSNNAFWLISVGVIIIGDFFTLVFLIGVPERRTDISRKMENESASMSGLGTKWYNWFKVPMFYQVGVVYTLSRVSINISQIFMPFFIELWLGFGKSSETIAIVPIVNMGVGLLTTFFLKRINKKWGRRMSYIIGVVAFGAGLVIEWFLPKGHTDYSMLIYAVAFLFGIGQTVVLVTAISMEADTVGKDTRSGAFVYGFISALEKCGTGAAIISSSSYSNDVTAVRLVEIFVPAGALLLGLFFTFTIIRYWKSAPTDEQKPLLKGEIQ